MFLYREIILIKSLRDWLAAGRTRTWAGSLKTLSSLLETQVESPSACT